MAAISARRREGLLRYGPVLLVLALAPFDLAVTGEPPATLVSMTVSVWGGLALLWRRTVPTIVAAAVVAPLAIISVLDVAPLTFAHQVAALMATFALGARARGRDTVVGIAVIVVGIGTVFVSTATSPVEVVFPLFYFSTAWVLGRSLSAWRARTEELRDLTSQLEAQRDQQARLAVAEERARIARELHDIVAHTLSTIVLQAEAADELMSTDTDDARKRVRAVEAAAREGLSDMRRLLGAVREGGDDLTPMPPQPSIASIGALVERMREADLPVELTCEGDVDGLPPGLQVSAYRIVQEALTNTLRHGGRVAVTVALRLQGGTLHLEVADRGRRGTASGTAAGHGLIGMRERAALFGGTVDVHGGEHGWTVRAVLPVDAAGL